VEPLPADSPLWDLPNVLISPHSASTPPSENERILDIFLHNLRCWLDGRLGDMHNILDKRLMY
jgi:phosphoglycerate dehydrogenase-like enzyme